MEDITPQTELITSTPEEAAKNIEGAKFFDMSPSSYKENAKTLQREKDNKELNTSVSPSVAEYASTSEEHAALVSKSSKELSFVEQQVKLFNNMFTGRDTQQGIIDLSTKKMEDPRNFTEDDALKLFMLNEDLKDESKRLDGLGAGAVDQLPANLTSFAMDAAQTTYKHSALIGAATGAGAVVGNVPGALFGFGLSLNVAMAYDDYPKQTALIYNDLSNAVGKSGEPLNLDETYKKNLSKGISLVSSAVNIAAGVAVGKSIPFLNNFLKGTKLGQTIVVNPAMEALRATLYNIGKTTAIGASGASFAEMTKILGEEMAQVKGGEESDYLGALERGSERIAAAGLTGAAISGTISSGFAIKTFKDRLKVSEQRFTSAKQAGITPQTERLIGTEKTLTQQSADILHFDGMLEDVTKKINSSEMNKLSPNEAQKIKKAMFEKTDIKSVVVHPETIPDDKRAQVLNILDPSGEAAKTNAPINLSLSTYLDAVEVVPEINVATSLDADTPTVTQASEHLTKVAEVEKKRQKLLEKLNIEDVTPEDKVKLQKQLDELSNIDEINVKKRQAIINKMNNEKTIPEELPSLQKELDAIPNVPLTKTPPIKSEEEYLNQPVFTETIEGIFPEKELAKINETQKLARQNVLDNLKDGAQYEMDQIKDFMTEVTDEIRFEEQIDRFKNSPENDIVNRFTKENIGGLPKIKINPATISEEARTLDLENNEQLKKHKVFAKGGMDADDAANLLGVKDGDTLLEILATTPSEDEVIQLRADRRRELDQQKIRDNVDINKVPLIEALNETVKVKLNEMKFLLSKEWPTTKGVFRRLSIKPPKIEQIIEQAKDITAKTTVGLLNKKIYEKGEVRSRAKVADAILNQDPYKAAKAKEAEALNIALQVETMKTTAKINRAKKRIINIDHPDTQKMLKDAGSSYVDSMNEILDVYNLDPRKKGTSEEGSFLKYVDNVAKNGDLPVEIPERFSDVRVKIDDMTTEQFLKFDEVIRNILHNAEVKNKLYAKHKRIYEAVKLDEVATILENQAKKLPDYDPSRNDIKQVNESSIEKTGKMLESIINLVERPQHILLKLDDNNSIGPWNDYIFGSITEALNSKNEVMLKLREHVIKLIKNAGKEEFDNLKYGTIIVPEFKGIKGLNDGVLTRENLFVLELNMHNEGNIKAVERFGVNRQVIKDVLDRLLPANFKKLAQDFRNIYKSFRNQIIELEKRTTGRDLDMMEDGYYPLMYLINKGKIQAKRTIGTIESIRQTRDAEAATRQGHLEQRVEEADNLIDLSLDRMFHNLDQVIHDITHREAIIDTSKILANEKVRKAMIAGVGLENYQNVSQMIIDVSDSITKQYNYAEISLANLIRKGSRAASIAFVGGKLSSTFIQLASLPFALDKMGIYGPKHVGLVITRLVNNPSLLPEFMKLADEIHPPSRDIREDIEGEVVQNLLKLIPKRKTKLSAVTIDPIKAVGEFSTSLAFVGMGAVDQFNKRFVTLAAYSQAINGDVKGLKAGDHELAVKYATNITELTQTHNNVRNKNPLQKIDLVKELTMFQSDQNNVLNGFIARTRELKLRAIRTGDAVAKKEYLEASKIVGGGILNWTVYLYLTLGIATLYEEFVRGAFKDREKEPKDPSDLWKTIPQASLYTAFSSTPVFSQILYASTKTWERKKIVSTPFTTIYSNMATGLSGIKHFLDFTEKYNVTNNELHALLFTVGLFTKIPVNAAFQFGSKPDLTDIPRVMSSKFTEASKAIEKYLSKPHEDIDPEFIENLKKLKHQIDSEEKAIEEDKLTKPPNK